MKNRYASNGMDLKYFTIDGIPLNKKVDEKIERLIESLSENCHCRHSIIQKNEINRILINLKVENKHKWMSPRLYTPFICKELDQMILGEEKGER